MKKFGEILKTLREENGLSQSDVARLSGVPQNSISRYEAGADPTWDSLCKIADALNVSLEVFRGKVLVTKIEKQDIKKVRITVTLVDGENESELGKIEKKLPR